MTFLHKKIILIFCLIISINISAELSVHEKALLEQLISCVYVPENIITSLEKLPFRKNDPEDEKVFIRGKEKNILFSHYPELKKNLSYIPLGDFPTPIHRCHDLEKSFSYDVRLFVKNDGLTGNKDIFEERQFGGNKLRKLQYLLADALANEHESVMTFGCAGSNHALQTTICSKLVGLHPICMLLPQPNSHIVQRNLLLQGIHGAELYFSPDKAVDALMATSIFYDFKQQSGKFPYIIPTGGSCARGCIGYVEAAFELKKQIDEKLMNVPDRIYVTLGSGGTAAGLLLGLKAAQISTKVYLVIDEPEKIKDAAINTVKKLFSDTNALVQKYDSTFPSCSLSENDYEVVTDCAGDEYGLFTQEAIQAMDLMYTCENIKLDGTYTGKCFSALVRDMWLGKCDNQTILFWNTFCGENFTDKIENFDYHNLPKAFHHYFEEPTQNLDIHHNWFFFEK